MLLRGIVILLLAILGAGYLDMGLSSASGPDATENQDAYADTGTVAAHLMDAFTARDIDTTMSDYAENAVLIDPDGMYTGVESIRARLLEAMQYGDQTDAPFAVTSTQITGSLAYVLWEWTMTDGSVVTGSDTIIVKHGKIARHTVAYFQKSAPVADEPSDMMGDDATDASASEG